MLDMFTFVRNMLCGKFTTKCEHFATHSKLHVYCGRDYRFDITVTENGYEIKELNGTVLNKGENIVEYAKFLKDNDWLNSGFEV